MAAQDTDVDRTSRGPVGTDGQGNRSQDEILHETEPVNLLPGSGRSTGTGQATQPDTLRLNHK